MMAPRHLNFLGNRACLRISSSSDFAFCCGSHLIQNYTQMKLGQFAEKDGQYIFCQTNEEAKSNQERYNQGLLTYKEVPVVRSTKHIELVYKDETMQKFKSHLEELEDHDYQAMAAAFAAAEEKTTADQMIGQVITRIPTPAINYDKLASILAAEERKTTDQIVSHVLAGFQQPAIDYSKLASFLAFEEKKFLDKIISQTIGSIQHPTIDYDKLVIAFDRHSDGSNVDVGPCLICVVPMLVLILTIFGSCYVAIKRALQKAKRFPDALDKAAKKCSTSTEKVKTAATTNMTSSVLTFTEYVHGKAKPHYSTPEPNTTTGATASLDKAKVVSDDLSGFKNPAERELVEDMLLDATLDIMEFGERMLLQKRDSFREPEGKKSGLDLVDKISEKGKQYTDKAKRIAGVGSSNTHALENKYKETLDTSYNTGPSVLRVAAKKHESRCGVYEEVHDTSLSAIGADSHSSHHNKEVDADAAVESSGWKEQAANLINSTTLGMVRPLSITESQPASFKEKPRRPVLAWQESLDQATRFGPEQGKFNLLRAAFRPHRTYTKENRRYYARQAAKLHEQRTRRRLKVTDDAILSGVFHEEADT